MGKPHVRLGVIGGLERSRASYDLLATSYGVEASFHGGEMTSRGARTVEHLVERCDVIVIVTDVNSHGAVQLARRRLRERGRSPLLMRRCGLARFALLLAALRARYAAPPESGNANA